MPDKDLSLDQIIDKKLADFADRVKAADSGDVDMSEQDLEVQKLEEVVLLLNRNARDIQAPSREMQDRIRVGLVRAWNNNQETSQSSLMTRISDWVKKNPRTLVYASSFAVVFIMALIALPALNDINILGSAGNIPGGDNATSELSIVMIVLLLLMTGLFIWFLARTKK